MGEDSTRKLTADQKLDLLLARTEKLEKEFGEFRAFVEPKLSDTKPIWERALTQIMEVKAEVTETHERLAKVENGLAKVEKELRLLNHKFENQTLDFTNTRAEVRELQHRVDELERPRR
jgi:peptidoglycan hydrolase CwlO-like protein